MSALRRIFLEVITAADTGTIEAIASDLRESVPAEVHPLGQLAARLVKRRAFLVRDDRVMMCTREFANFYAINDTPIPRGIRLFFFAEVCRG